MPDAHANFAYSTVLTAPSPALSGVSLVLPTGMGALFPVAPFNATVWPAGVPSPLSSNAEIVRVTAKAADVFTILRAQEFTSARMILAGDQIANTITAKTLTDIETVEANRDVGGTGQPAFGIPGDWSNYTADYATQFYRDPFGRVFLEGLVKGSLTVSQYTYIFTLPVGYRPQRYQVFTVIANNVASRVDVDPSGPVIYSGTSANAAFVSLASMSWRAYQ